MNPSDFHLKIFRPHEENEGNVLLKFLHFHKCTENKLTSIENTPTGYLDLKKDLKELKLERT